MNHRHPFTARQFIATTPGLSATRWLAFVLASNTDVFVAHGHFPLDSVLANDFHDEKKKGDTDSLTIGTIMSEYYQMRTIAEVFDEYRAIRPHASAYGNIHSYTLDGLMRRAKDTQELDGICVVNILRHPVSFIDSHFSLVRSAERHADLYRHYVDTVFQDALGQFPELLLMDCSDYREFLAFAVSCLSVSEMANDFAHSGFRHFRMESLTAEAEALQEFCELLTGATYPLELVEPFIKEGPINRHRKVQASRDPSAIYASWCRWKRDMAYVMIPDAVVSRFGECGYDVGMLRDNSGPQQIEQFGPTAPCLLDRLREMDDSHPAVAILATGAAAQPILIEPDYKGFNLVDFRGHIYAVACSLGPIDLATLAAESLRQYQREDHIMIGGSIDQVKQMLQEASRPRDPRRRWRGIRGGGITDVIGW